ncbi:hypothetical protein [Nocardia jinanensis]|uniref:hypothetical protein n=1 Tax=Nocardia jinanensis TaxID=382504 RepID=UPI000738B285|nr:hypothetical protein [Nocardia jinanensis]
MAGILGFSYADAGALVGGLVGGFTPAGFVGSAVLSGTLAGVGAVMDGRDMSGVLTEAGVAAIGAAGGGWAGGELARAGMKFVAPRLAKAAADGASGGLQKIGLEAAETVLGTTGRYDAGLIPAVAAGFAGFWATDQGKMLTIPTVDIGNGGCPVEMRSLQMPAELVGTVGDMYRKLPAYLCDVWRCFGTGNQPTTPTVKLPVRVTAEETAGIPAYAAKVGEFNTMIDGFVRLDRQVLDLVAAGVKDIDEQGRLAVSRLIETVNKDAGTAPPSGKSLETYALDRANNAFADGREILSQAIVMSRGVAGDVDQNTDRMNRPPETPEPEPEGPGGPGGR